MRPPKAVSSYLSAIGRRGGQAGRGRSSPAKSRAGKLGAARSASTRIALAAIRRQALTRIREQIAERGIESAVSGLATARGYYHADSGEWMDSQSVEAGAPCIRVRQMPSGLPLPGHYEWALDTEEPRWRFLGRWVYVGGRPVLRARRG